MHDAVGTSSSPQAARPGSPGASASAALGDSHSLAIHLEPALREACHGRLGPIEWFHAAWQHGGAATGFASWNDGPGPARRAIVKLPVGPVELHWSRDLARVEPDPRGPLVPRVLAAGDSIGGLDLGWLVSERLEGKPLSTCLDEAAVHDLLRTLVEFQIAAPRVRPVDPARDHPQPLNWDTNILRAKQAVRESKMPEQQRWLEALRHVYRHLDHVVGRWNAREVHTWCHGDLHPGNALRRAPGTPSERCVLIDLAMVHAGHWVEDAVYLERQFWGHSELLHGIKPLAEVSRLRREAGLPVETHSTDVAIARRLLMASVVPLFLDREHNAKYLHGALETIEKYLPQLH